MDIRLLKLDMRNFKGCAHKTIAFDGLDTNIFGDNGTGKTTINDAFCWLMFDKNSMGSTNFEVKPIGASRPEVEVEAVLSVDGRKIELKKVLTEKWQTKRGDEAETFTGHETAYWVNKIPKKVSEYKAFVDSIVSEDEFKRLTSAEYFLGLKKPDMRKVLIDMVGNVRDEDVAKNDPQLNALVESMHDNGYSIDDMLKLVKQNISLYNGEQSDISPRIDEVRRNMPEEADWDKLNEGLEKGKQYITAIDAKLALSRDLLLKQSRAIELKNTMAEYRTERLQQLNAEHLRDIELNSKLNGEMFAMQNEMQALKQKRGDMVGEITRYADKISELIDLHKSLDAKIDAQSSSVFEPIKEGSLNCDKCGQMLTAIQISLMNEANSRLFESRKAEARKLLLDEQDNVMAAGKRETALRTDVQQKLEDVTNAITKLDDAIKYLAGRITLVTRKLEDSLEVKDMDLKGDVQWDLMVSELDSLNAEISDSTTEQTDELLEKKTKILTQMEQIRSLLLGRDKKIEAEARIEELTKRGRELAGLIATERSKQYQCERFIRAKAEMLQETINALFENLSFRLFDVQINGGIVDDCTPMINGVEYRDASNSERIRANMDIINAMQKAKDIHVVVFIDNAEACTYLRRMNCQVIRLVVSEEHHSIHVETMKGEKVDE